MIPEALLIEIVRGAFALGTAKVEWGKIEPRLKGKTAEEIPSVLDEMHAEASQAFDKTIDTMPEDPA